jgi:glycosyltransferase involved in cell wall biosynthesis
MEVVKIKANEPLVSVIITAFNREKYIAEAIESVLNSTYENFELIICDDASTDGTISISQAYAKKDCRVKVYANSKNLKQFQNRNKSAEYANGKYIKYLDSDDIIYPQGLKAMVYAMEKYPEAGIGFSFFRYDGTSPLPYLVSSVDAYNEHFCKGGFLYEGPTGAIYRKDYFHKIGKFDIEFDVAADYAFNLKAALYKPVVIFPRDLCWWRRHEFQEFQLESRSYNFLNFKISNYYLNHPKCPLSKDKAATALGNVTRVTGRKVLKNLFKMDFKEAKEIQNNCNFNTKDIIFSLFPTRLMNKFKF